MNGGTLTDGTPQKSKRATGLGLAGISLDSTGNIFFLFILRYRTETDWHRIYHFIRLEPFYFCSIMDTAQNGQNNVDKKPVCKYGTNCYRKNKGHLDQYKHPVKRQQPVSAK